MAHPAATTTTPDVLDDVKQHVTRELETRGFTLHPAGEPGWILLGIGAALAPNLSVEDSTGTLVYRGIRGQIASGMAARLAEGEATRFAWADCTRSVGPNGDDRYAFALLADARH